MGKWPESGGRRLLAIICCINLDTDIHLSAPSLHVPTPGGSLGASPPSLEFHLVLALWPGLYRHLLALEETARTRRGVESNGEGRNGGLGWTGPVILGTRWAGDDEGLKKGRSGPGMRRDVSTSSALGWSGARSLSGLSG